MGKKKGNINVPVAGDRARDNWGLNLQKICEMVADFLQGEGSGTEFGLENHKFKVNPDTKKIALYEKVNGVWNHKIDFGSVITDRFVYTKPMGGIMFRNPADGYDYHAVRTSPTGKGTAITVGNYADTLFLSSDVTGVKMVSELGPAFHHTEVDARVITKSVNAKKFEHLCTVASPRLIYGGNVVLKNAPAKDQRLISRMWTEDKNGKVLHETISAYDWGLSDDSEELRIKCGAEYIDLKKGEVNLFLPSSIPLPVTDYGAGWDVKLCWEFKENVEIIGNAFDDLKFGIDWEEGKIESVASREWVNEKSWPLSCGAWIIDDMLNIPNGTITTTTLLNSGWVLTSQGTTPNVIGMTAIQSNGTKASSGAMINGGQLTIVEGVKFRACASVGQWVTSNTQIGFTNGWGQGGTGVNVGVYFEVINKELRFVVANITYTKSAVLMANACGTLYDWRIEVRKNEVYYAVLNNGVIKCEGTAPYTPTSGSLTASIISYANVIKPQDYMCFIDYIAYKYPPSTNLNRAEWV